MSKLAAYFKPLIFEDSSEPTEAACHLAFVQQMAREAGTWSEITSPEQTALALTQITAAHVLPPLVDLPCGTDLLTYSVQLREHLDGALVDELAMVLKAGWRELGWEQVGSSMYMCVIGAGAAACINMAEGELYLRYDSELEHALYLAGRTIDLPRSRLFLQTALYERFDCLLAQVRMRTWHWLID